MSLNSSIYGLTLLFANIDVFHCVQVLGMILIIVGALAQSYFAGGPFHEAIFIIIIGCIIFVVAFFGCCGAIKEHHCLLITVCVHTRCSLIEN